MPVSQEGPSDVAPYFNSWDEVPDGAVVWKYQTPEVYLTYSVGNQRWLEHIGWITDNMYGPLPACTKRKADFYPGCGCSADLDGQSLPGVAAELNWACGHLDRAWLWLKTHKRDNFGTGANVEFWSAPEKTL